MRRAEDLQVAAPDAEHRVAAEIDALDIRAYRKIGLRNAEVQPAIVGVESEKVPLEGGSIAGVSFGGEHHRPGSAAERRVLSGVPATIHEIAALHLVLACTSCADRAERVDDGEPAGLA